MSRFSLDGSSRSRLDTTNTTPYDHEIFLLDATAPSPKPHAPAGDSSSISSATILSRSPTATDPQSPHLTRKRTLREELARRKYSKWQDRGVSTTTTHEEPPIPPSQPSNPPTINEIDPSSSDSDSPPQPPFAPPRPSSASLPDTEIDILYENQRGHFLFSYPQYSHKSLLNLDPSPWSTSTFSNSPVDILTAQLPDPTTWRWAWKRWYVDMGADVDDEGWQYSFSFSQRYGWSGVPVWWHGWVRRRRWVRKRVRRRVPHHHQHGASSPETTSGSSSSSSLPLRQSLQQKRGGGGGGGGAEVGGGGEGEGAEKERVDGGDYFTILSSTASATASSFPHHRHRHGHLGSRRHRGSGSGGGGHRRQGSRAEGEEGEEDGGEGGIDEIASFPALMAALKDASIDREKLLAVSAFVAHPGSVDELVYLGERMEGVMGSLTFQASRRALAAELVRVAEEAEGVAEEEEEDGRGKEGKMGAEGEGSGGRTDGDRGVLEKRKEMLQKASAAAEKEVRRLEFWSDVKDVVRRGETGGAVDPERGWRGVDWVGVDISGPRGETRRDVRGGGFDDEDDDDEADGLESEGDAKDGEVKKVESKGKGKQMEEEDGDGDSLD